MPVRNVLNVAEVDRFTNRLAELTDNPALQRWVCGPVRNWLLRDYPEFEMLVRMHGEFRLFDQDLEDVGPYPPERGPLPLWIGNALDRGDQVILPRLDDALEDRIIDVMAFLEVASRYQRRTSLDRLPFRQAELEAEAWRAGHAVMADRDEVVYRHPSGLKIVQVATRAALVEEGERMRHCVGSFAESVARRQCRIFSLRAPGRRRPLATIEIDHSGEVGQIRGFANGPVSARHRSVICDFLSAHGYRTDEATSTLRWLAHVGLAFEGDFASALLSPAGRTLLRRHAYAGDGWGARYRSHKLTETIAEFSWELDSNDRRVIFDTLKPRGRLLRFRSRGAYWVYENRLPVFAVDMPLMVVNLAAFGVFDGIGVDQEVDAIQAAVEGELVGLAFERPGPLFDLGEHDGPFATLMHQTVQCFGSAADVLLSSRFDMSRPLEERHGALRRRLNWLSRRPRFRRMRPSRAHAAVRAAIEDCYPTVVI